METLYRKVAVSERNPAKEMDYVGIVNASGTIETLFHVCKGRFSNTHVAYLSKEKDVTNSVKYWLEEIPDPTVQLKADKAELLELMAEMKESFDHKAWVTEMELKSFSSRIESLIQKHKQ